MYPRKKAIDILDDQKKCYIDLYSFYLEQTYGPGYENREPSSSCRKGASS